jgi:hypothetical protein
MQPNRRPGARVALFLCSKLAASVRFEAKSDAEG